MATTVLVLTAYVINLFYQDYFTEIYQYPNFLIGIFMLVYVFGYMRQLLRSDDVIYFNKIPALWICIGLIVYQLILVLLFMMRNELASLDATTYRTLLVAINIIFYSSISYGLILSKNHE